MPRVGIKDIALAAEVSIATVSNALRNPGRVSDATRKKVLEAAQRMGYTPNRLAASLRTHRSGNIVVIIPDVTDSFNAGVIGGIEKVAQERGYSVLLGDTQGLAERERQFAAMTQSGQADGIILMSHRLPFDAPVSRRGPTGTGSVASRVLLESLPPLVNGCERIGIKGLPLVAVDDVRVGADATRHLLEFGHRDVGVITGNPASRSSRDRLQGLRQAMGAAGLAVNEDWVVNSEYSLPGGERGAERLFAQDRHPTAVFCFSDEIALGCLYTLRQLGIGVPESVSLIGVDDIPFARYSAPPLTTIAQPVADIGATCATLLLDLIEGRKPERLQYILPHELCIRGSSRRLD